MRVLPTDVFVYHTVTDFITSNAVGVLIGVAHTDIARVRAALDTTVKLIGVSRSIVARVIKREELKSGASRLHDLHTFPVPFFLR